MKKYRGIQDLPKNLNRYDESRGLDVHGDVNDRPEDNEHQMLDEEIATRLDDTKPAAFAVFHEARQALKPSLVDSMKSDRPVLIVIRLPGAAWHDAALEGLRRAVEAEVRTIPSLDPYFLSCLPTKDARSKWERKPAAERAESIGAGLAHGSTVLMLGPTDEIDERIEAFVDRDVDLRQMTEGLAAAVGRRFGDTDAAWPPDLLPATIDPLYLDLAFARADTAADAVKTLRRISKASRSAIQGPRLEDLHGYGEAKGWGLRLVAALLEYQAGRRSWSDVDGGALLVGAPGTGKTLYASALAHSAGITLIPTSYAAWQSAGDGHLGTLINEMRRVFAEAVAAPPSIIFIDEIDSLQARGSTSRYDDWWRAIINCLLECLDGTGRREGVVVLAACNDAANLDPAVVRSGRLDRTFTIQLPGEEDLARIFQHHLPSLSEVDIQPAAVTLSGSTSGADAARIARDIRQVARSAGRDVVAADLLSVAIPPDDRPVEIRRRIAVHEAGHAIALLVQGIVPDCLSIVHGKGGGRVTHEQDRVEGRLADFHGWLTVMLAGRAAEDVILGAPSAGAGGLPISDLGRATTLLSHIEGRLGLGSQLSMSDHVNAAVIEARLQRSYAEASLLMVRHAPAVKALAEVALAERVLGRARLQAFWAAQIVRGSTPR